MQIGTIQNKINPTLGSNGRSLRLGRSNRPRPFANRVRIDQRAVFGQTGRNESPGSQHRNRIRDFPIKKKTRHGIRNKKTRKPNQNRKPEENGRNRGQEVPEHGERNRPGNFGQHGQSRTRNQSQDAAGIGTERLFGHRWQKSN